MNISRLLRNFRATRTLLSRPMSEDRVSSHQDKDHRRCFFYQLRKQFFIYLGRLVATPNHRGTQPRRLHEMAVECGLQQPMEALHSPVGSTIMSSSQKSAAGGDHWGSEITEALTTCCFREQESRVPGRGQHCARSVESAWIFSRCS